MHKPTLHSRTTKTTDKLTDETEHLSDNNIYKNQAKQL